MGKSRQAKMVAVSRACLDVARSMDGRIARIREQMAGHPAAARYDDGGGRSGEVWCWQHESPARSCHANGLTCAGEAVLISDPVGEAAVRGDGASRDLRRLDGIIRKMEVLAAEATRIMDAYDPARALTPADLAALAEDGQSAEPGCALCARVAPPGAPQVGRGRPVDGSPGWWNEVHRTTDFANILADPLDEPTPMCAAHYRRVRLTGCIPSVAETAHFRDHGKWPKLRLVSRQK